jgi:hypothetical protein
MNHACRIIGLVEVHRDPVRFYFRLGGELV